MLLTQRTVIRRHAVTVVRVLAGRNLVDAIANKKRVLLSGTENQSLLGLLDHAHEDLHAFAFAFLDLDVAVEIRLLIDLSHLDITTDDRVVGSEGVIIHRRLDLLHAEGREKSVVDPILERVSEHRLAEIGVGVDVVLALWRGGETEMHGG